MPITINKAARPGPYAVRGAQGKGGFAKVQTRKTNWQEPQQAAASVELEKNDGEIEIDMLDLLYHLVDKLPQILIAGAICALLTAAWVFFVEKPVYQATSKLYVLSSDSLVSLRDDDQYRYMMVAYSLKNTLTENGYVARGVCETDPDGFLRNIVERTHIISSCDGPLFTEDGKTYHLLPPDSPVSMNMWGFTPSLLRELESRFPVFLRTALRENPLKGEFFLPFVVNELLSEGKATARVLKSEDRWWGVTYQEDKPQVKAALKALADQGLYPSPLWD